MRSALGSQHASRVGTELQINSEEALYHTRFSERLNQLSTAINGQYRGVHPQQSNNLNASSTWR